MQRESWAESRLGTCESARDCNRRARYAHPVTEGLRTNQQQSRDRSSGSNSWTQRKIQRLLGWLSDERMPLLAVALFALTRVLQLVVLAALKSPDSLARLATKGDAEWYLRLAEHGYWIDPEAGLEVEAEHNRLSMAFFPLYPSLIRLADAAGVPAPGVMISSIAALIAAWALFRLGEKVANARTGVVLAVAWGVMPGSIALSMGLSEPVFMALAMWALVLLLRDQLLGAASLSFLAGLTRPTSVAVILAVLWVAIPVAIGGPGRWRGLAAIVIAPLGLAAYLSLIAFRLGSPLGYLDVQRRWETYNDWGVTVSRTIRDYLFAAELPFTVIAWALVTAIVLLGWLVLIRPPAPILIYSFVVMFLIIVQANRPHSRLRFLMVAATLLIPPAIVLARARPWLATLVLATAAILSAIFGSWFLIEWRASI